jgi:hypothetical protein
MTDLSVFRTFTNPRGSIVLRFSNKALLVAGVVVGAAVMPASMGMSHEAPPPRAQEEVTTTHLAEGFNIGTNELISYMPFGIKVTLEHCQNTGTP